MFIYPDNLKAKPMLWLWLLRDIAVIGIGALLSVLALTEEQVKERFSLVADDWNAPLS